MYKLKNNPILAPYQQTILKLFFASPFGKPFFLTGGTALSAFYFAHRMSRDFDFFTLTVFNPAQLTATVKDIAKSVHATITVKVGSPTYQELYLENRRDKWIQRIDIVHEQPRHFGKLSTIEGIVVDSLENIATNKILALFGRLEPKDYVDFYVIMKSSRFTFDKLFALAQKKDLGLFEFYFANSISNVSTITHWPPMKEKIDIKEVVNFYQNLSKKLLMKIKPKDDITTTAVELI